MAWWVFVGAFPLLGITSRPNTHVSLDLWVLIWNWIRGYLPPEPSCVCVCVCSWGHGRIHSGRPPSERGRSTHKNQLLSAKQAPFLILANYETVKHSTRVSLLLFFSFSLFFWSCRATAVLHRPSDEARQLEQAEARHVNSR